MIKLNLLPEKVRAAERLQLILLIGGAVYLVGLLLLGWAWASAKGRVAEAQVKVDAVTAALNAPELREAVQAVDRFTKDEKEKNDKASIVNNLRKRQVTLLRMLDALPDWSMNGQVWFQSLEVKMERGERRVMLEGHASTPLVFAHFFTNLESQPIVTKIKIEDVPRREDQMGRSVTRFRVSFALEDYQ
jgi:Tfp pilus assembly protein PilN